MKISSHDARSSLSPRAGRGRGEGASTLLERCKSSPDRQDTPYQLRIAERPLNPSFSPHAGRRSRERRGESDGASALVLATHPRPRLADQSYEFSSPQRKRREAERRQARLSRGASPRSGCCHPSALRARPRVQRNALAFRRSTAALAPAICRSSIQAALHAMRCAPRLSEAPRAPVVMPAGSMPGPPESGSDELPPAGTAPTPSVGVTG
jgi:hypothetical protein